MLPEILPESTAGILKCRWKLVKLVLFLIKKYWIIFMSKSLIALVFMLAQIIAAEPSQIQNTDTLLHKSND